MPRMQQRLERDPLALRHARWVDRAPDLRHHVWSRRIGPDRADLDAAVSSIMESPLDHGLPLWDLHVLRGLAEERWVLVWRMHHAMADGEGASMLLGHVYDVRRDGGSTMAQLLAHQPARTGGTGTDGPHSALESVARTARTLPPTARSVLDLVPLAPTELTGGVSSQRSWTSARIPLADARHAARSLEVTINDIVVTAVTGGFRDLLLGRGRLPGRSLRAVVPVSLRTPGDDRSDNQVSMISAGLPVGEPDLRARLARVHASTSRGKASLVPQLMGAVFGVIDRIVPAGLQEAAVDRMAPLSRLFVDTLVTNVPGPTIPLFFAGHEVRASYPIIPIDSRLRVTVGVVSYAGHLHLGVTADAVHVPDAAVLTAGIRRGFDQLRELAG